MVSDLAPVKAPRRFPLIVAFACAHASVSGSAAGQEQRPNAPDAAAGTRLAGLEERADRLRQEGRYAEALTTLKELSKERATALGPSHPQTTQALREVELLEKVASLGETDRRLFQEAEKEEDRGVKLFQDSQFAEAEGPLRRSLAIFERLCGSESHRVGLSRYNLGSNLEGQVRLGEAEEQLQRAIAVLRKTLGDSSEYLAYAYLSLGQVLDAQDRFPEANLSNREALQILSKLYGERHGMTARAANNLAASLHRQGDYDGAEPFFRSVVTVYESLPADPENLLARALANLAANLDHQDNSTEAAGTYEKALAAIHGDSQEARRTRANILNNLTFNLIDQGKRSEATPRLLEAIRIKEKLYGPHHHETAVLKVNRGSMLAHGGQVLEGEGLIREGLSDLEASLGEDNPETVVARDDLAECKYLSGDIEGAISILVDLAKSYEVIRLRSGLQGFDRSVFTSRWNPLPLLAVCLARAGRTREAWERAESCFGRGLLDAISARSLRMLSAEEREQEMRLLRGLADEEKRIESLVGEAAVAVEVQKARTSRLQLEARTLQLELGFRERYGVAAGRLYDLSRIQRTLDAETAIVGWIDLEGQPNSKKPQGEHWVFALRSRGDPVVLELPGPSGDQPPDVHRKYLSRIANLLASEPANVGDVEAVESMKQSVFRLRLEPLMPFLRGKGDVPAVRRLVIIPGGWMSTVPVESLTDEFTISYSPSATFHAWLRERSEPGGMPAGNGILLLGDPEFYKPPADRSPKDSETKKAPTWRPLPGTRPEVKEIAKVVSAAVSRGRSGLATPVELLGPDASESRLAGLARTGALAQFRLLHLATHATFYPSRAFASELVLAHLEGKPSPSKLKAQEVLTWRLDADLVTLSCCESALGRNVGFEGHLGFVHAFLLAGARSLVSSLWKLDDEATHFLIVRFYKNLFLDGMPKARALQEARRWLRGLSVDQVRELEGQSEENTSRGAVLRPAVKRLDRRFPFEHPYYWAGVVLIGMPE